MIKHKRKRNAGLTLIEIMVAAVVVVVAVIGAIGFRYYCVLDARKATVQLTATRVGLLLLEGWNAMGARSPTDPSNNYDPLNLPEIGSQLKIVSDIGPEVPPAFNSFGSYLVVVDGAYYYATLSYQDEPSNDLRILNVSVAWPEGYPTGKFSDTDIKVQFTTKADLPG